MRRRRVRWVGVRGLAVAAMAALVTGSCGMRSAGATSRGSRDTITRDQMIEVNASTVFEAVQKLQPDWLSSRGPVSLRNSTQTAASVFMNGNQVADIDYLRNLRPDDVDRLRYYESGEASARFGMGHQRGVIEVIPRGQG